MTPSDLKAARADLGAAWGFGRPLHRSELGRACGLGPVDPGQMIRRYEDGRAAVPKTLEILITLYLRGIMPPDGLESLKG